MAKTRGIACDRCPKMVEVGKDVGWRQVVMRKRKADASWDLNEKMDLCPACCHDLGKWRKAYQGENHAEHEEPGHAPEPDEPTS